MWNRLNRLTYVIKYSQGVKAHTVQSHMEMSFVLIHTYSHVEDMENGSYLPTDEDMEWSKIAPIQGDDYLLPIDMSWSDSDDDNQRPGLQLLQHPLLLLRATMT